MTGKRVAAVVGFVSLALAPVVIRAHHSFASEFDVKRPIKMTGSINKVEWMNPHAFFYIDVTEVCDGPPPPDPPPQGQAPAAAPAEPPPIAWKCTKTEATKAPNWGFEMGSPNGLMRLGWTRTSLKSGDVITVEGTRAKDGSTFGNARTVKLTSGRTLFAGSSEAQ